MASRDQSPLPIPDPQHLYPAATQGSLAAPTLPSTDTGENSASELIEAPQRPGRAKLDPHDFADGGGGGGAEAFSRKKTK